MPSIFQILQLTSALLTIVLVLLHTAKGEGLGSIGSAAQMFKNSSNIEQGLNVTTWVVAFVFLAVTALLSWGIVQ